MANKDLKVTISASDNASDVLAKIGDAAKTLGESLEEAGQSADSLENVTSSASKVGPAIESASSQGVSGFSALASEVKRLDSEISTVGKTLVGFGAAITGAFAAPLVKGTKAAWDQVSAVESATFALRGYGDSAEDVQRVLRELTEYAQDASRSGGIFWSEDLYNSAQNLVLMGAELQNVTRYVEIMSRSVGTTTTTWDELDRVIGRVISTGRLTTIEFELLQQAGFQLDESLRNSTVTAEQLFSALDQGLSADVLLGAADTIQGRLGYLQGAFISLGQAVLGVNEDLEFVAGGLGDQLVTGIDSLIGAMDGLQPAAAAVGEGLGSLVSGALRLVDTFAGLSPEAQKFITMATGITGVASLAAGSILLMVGPVVRLGSALVALGRSAAIMRTLTMAVNPLTLGLSALALVGYSVWDSWREGERVAESLEGAIRSLNEAETELRLNREDSAAESVRLFRMQTEGIEEHAQRYIDNEKQRTQDALAMADELGIGYADAYMQIADAYSRSSDEAEAFADAQATIGQAFQDQRIDHAALGAALDELHEKYVTGQITLDEYDAGVIDVANNLDRYRASADDAAGATDRLTDSATGLGAAFNLLKDEASGVLDELLNLNTVTEDDSFADRLLKTLGMDASQRGEIEMTLETVRGLRTELADMPGPGASQQEWLDWVNEADRGTAEHTRRINAANEARREETSETQRSALAKEMDARATDGLAEALENQNRQMEMAATLSESWNAHLEARADLIAENIERLHEAAGVGDPLSQWNMGEHATQASMLAGSVGDAATALDTVYRVIVSNTDAIGNQVSSVEDWALELINVRGEYGAIDDLLAAGTITIGQYNAAQEAQETISAANLAIQQDILTIQAQQAPLIADHTAALADQMSIVADMPAQQQLITLGWMDATTAGRAMEFQTLAVAAAAGELGAGGREAFESMITGAAQADPVLKALLEDMGLISEGAEGEIVIHWDGAEGAMSDMERLRLTINALIETLGGEIPDLDINVTGVDDIESARTALESLPDDVGLEVDITVPSGVGDRLRSTISGLLGGPAGDGTGGPEVTVPVVPSLAPGAADSIQEALTVEQVDMPVGADTGPALQDLEGLRDIPPVEVPVTLSTAIGGAVDWATDALGGLFGGADAPQDVTVTIDAVDNATPIISDVTAQLTALGAWGATTVEIVGDASNAQGVIDAYRGYDGTTIAEPSVDILGDGSNAQGVIDAYRGYDGVTIADAIVAISGDASNAQGVIDAYRGYDGVVLATSYIDIITRTSTVDNNRHGGIPGYAHGGVLFEGGEAGPEIAHFAHGGTALLPYHGLYTAPPNTYVSPNNATGPISTVNEGNTYQVHIHGNVYGIDDLAGALEDAMVQRRAGAGGGR